MNGSRWLRLVITAGLLVLVFWRTAGMPMLHRVTVALLLAILPALLIDQGRQPGDADLIRAIPRSRVYLLTAFQLLVLGGAVFLLARLGGASAAELGFRMIPSRSLLLWSAGTTAVGFGAMALTRLLGVRETSIVMHLRPRTPRERAGFALLSLSAGLGEEIAYRGVPIPLLIAATGSTPLAVLLSSAAFGALHGYQAATGAIRAGVVGLILAVPFIATGSLLPSMIAHATINMLIGLVFADWFMGEADDRPSTMDH